MFKAIAYCVVFWASRSNGAFVGKMYAAILRSSANRSCMAYAAAMTCWRVLESIVGRGI